MAQNAAKRNAANAAKARKIWVFIVLLINVLYFGISAMLDEIATWSWGMYSLIIASIATQIIGVYGIVSSASQGTTGPIYHDLIYVSGAAQLFSLVWLKAWFLLLAVPAYGAYKLWSMFSALKGAIAPPTQDTTNDISSKEEEKLAKRREKRRQNRQRRVIR